MTEEWDFDAQRADTAGTLEELFGDDALSPGMAVTLDVFLRPADGADPAALERGLAMFGYSGERMTDEAGGVVFVVSVSGVALGLDDVWTHEERISRVALARGFRPDGWGFFEPD